MKLRILFLIFMFLVQAVSSIHCFYCLNCTAQDKRTLQKCSYKFTHCAAVQVVLRKQKASLFVCALSMTCTKHFTTESFDQVGSCYICNQDFCNAYMEAPFVYTSSRSHCLRKHLIAFCYIMTLLFSFLITK